jgi:hypothetical protein
MTKVPSLDYEKLINALRRDGWVVVRQKRATYAFINELPLKCSS